MNDEDEPINLLPDGTWVALNDPDIAIFEDVLPMLEAYKYIVSKSSPEGYIILEETIDILKWMIELHQLDDDE